MLVLFLSPLKLCISCRVSPRKFKTEVRAGNGVFKMTEVLIRMDLEMLFDLASARNQILKTLKGIQETLIYSEWLDFGTCYTVVETLLMVLF